MKYQVCDFFGPCCRTDVSDVECKIGSMRVVIRMCPPHVVDHNANCPCITKKPRPISGAARTGRNE